MSGSSACPTRHSESCLTNKVWVGNAKPIVSRSKRRLQIDSASGDDPDDFQPVTGLKLAFGKLRRGNGLAVVFDDDAPRQELLGDQEFLERARQARLDVPAIGDDKLRTHGWESFTFAIGNTSADLTNPERFKDFFTVTQLPRHY